MNKQIITEQETLEWLCLVGSLKIKELEKTATPKKWLYFNNTKPILQNS